MTPRRYLGRRPPRAGLAIPRLAEVAPSLADAAGSVDWSRSIAGYDALGNSVCGCCTLSAVGHAYQQFEIYSGRPFDITGDDVLAEYAKRGWVRGRPETDTGLVMTDVLHDWMTVGLTFGGAVDTIDGFAATDPANIAEAKQAIELFGGLLVGAELPISAEIQTGQFSVVPGPTGAKGGLGGHEMWADACNAWGVQLISWGAKVWAPWDWWLAYVDDVQVVLSRDWTLPDGRSPEGVDWAALDNAMRALPRFVRTA